MVDMEKICTRCSATKPLSLFPKYDKNHHRGICKECYHVSTRVNYNKHYQKNSEKIKEKNQALKRKRLINDVSFRLKCNVSRAINHYIEKPKNNRSVFKYLSYTPQDLKKHIESLWEDWMNWDNYGPVKGGLKTWQIDHIKPQSAFKFDSMDDKEFRECWDLTNLRPLESTANIRKGNSYE